jgi:hypothetical protein
MSVAKRLGHRIGEGAATPVVVTARPGLAGRRNSGTMAA